ncbi:MAG: DUF4389 domain-containing protein [Saccharothrix sp.]|nr:DUF4389 domain-containing protein [Saccharothrix sp.]
MTGTESENGKGASSGGVAAGASPVHVEGDLSPVLSRWLWLVKWLLLIPHLIVLVFLWLAFVLSTVAAFFAILFTGRYPRRIFDFNVGVLRWTWRVNFYGYSALGTDRYPAFRLAAAPEDEGRLDIAYPEHLSRGLVLVKWWLLALPHYAVVAAFSVGPWQYPGLATVLLLIAAVALLFTGRYPQGLFDLLVGMDRWLFRVVAYAALMTDVYPPFRLDQGAREPGAGASPAVGTAW